MLGVIFALLAALGNSLAVVLIKKEVNESNILSACLTLTVMGNIVLWPLAISFANLGKIKLEGLLFFAIGGILSPGIVRLLYYKGLELVGVSLNTAIVAGYPILSSIFGILLLGDIPTIENWIGMVCVIGGVASIEKGLSNHGSRSPSRKSLVFPLLASLVIAIAYAIRKHGLSISNEPLLGVSIGYLFALLLYLVLSAFRSFLGGDSFLRKSFRLFWKPGICLSFAWLSTFYALSHEKISIVAPLIQTQILFVFALDYVYLKELRSISFRLVASAILTVIGVIFVSVL